ncbi:interleukin 2 receptor, gamma a isoform X2 [Corythoichthys intestinalis]|uniref:interleukin 2 receptor, gamma a isoform X2 n=1 Tax=Corythoichthys intestinalis TaxID=161448 RepID=UPI0025A5B075|nr:interleukin 2 receptor, gamma a isoform X2 [Corythoichthys intestinalis]XP_057676293.1 interleukin 2 receptor, gamma a isoform X2 [Corythoichthys intestinalis]XP_057676294.1 interleukin 2 receptor, gamma a isoform X2 [Corythoichthys intestinalis]XP_057676295.1 interleukin 2 receptor, gamma a isoform X2 [Corythoichthys intestinalis]XP_057676296.1 interleukin 2 receptor, gamma a isoform X2 [Corythoichthys intestinalis]XP_057676297.1 interleukin 2 receptor, gamma a isoform X2 [Corythoichthys i
MRGNFFLQRPFLSAQRVTRASFARQHPDVDCVVLHLEKVKCTWNRHDNLSVNYTFFSWFHGKKASTCETYLTNNSLTNGCIQPYGDKLNRFYTFYTNLVYGNDSFPKEHELLHKVKLYPPTNLTVQNGSDLNLWFYWNQTDPKCVQNEVRYRTNYKKWDTYTVTDGKQNYCINLPSSRSQYELQVRSRLSKVCADSGWGDWSEPVFWGSSNSTESEQVNGSMFVWIIVYVLAPVILILLVVLLLRYERFRVIFIHVVPKPSLIQDAESWLPIPKGLKEGFKANYHEKACCVREYHQ